MRNPTQRKSKQNKTKKKKKKKKKKRIKAPDKIRAVRWMTVQPQAGRVTPSTWKPALTKAIDVCRTRCKALSGNSYVDEEDARTFCKLGVDASKKLNELEKKIGEQKGKLLQEDKTQVAESVGFFTQQCNLLGLQLQKTAQERETRHTRRVIFLVIVALLFLGALGTLGWWILKPK